MSAIWGAVSLAEKELNYEKIDRMKNAFSDCVIDRYEEVRTEKIYLACGIQYINKEACGECLPIRENNLFFDADVILDNRQELAEKYQIADFNAQMPDGTLLFEVYKKAGEKCLNDLLGAYVFVSVNEKEKAVEIISDAVGNRYVYYLRQDDILYFASLMKPLEQLQGKKQLNERWIADYLAQDDLSTFTDAEETPIEGIYRIPEAHILRFTKEGVSKRQYWKLTDIKREKNVCTDEEYRRRFVDLYRKCVTDVMRSSGEIGILLSGGLDSTSVAGLAAEYLKEQGKTLYSYTSVPFKGYVSDMNKFFLVDERNGIDAICRKYDNISASFLDLPEMNAWYDRKKAREIFEMPCKSPQNPLWHYASFERAYKDGVRVLLSGMFGNQTVSFGNLPLYIAYLFQRGHFIRSYQEIEKLHKVKGMSRKQLWRYVFSMALPRKYEVEPESLFEHSYADISYLNSNGAVKRAVEHHRRWMKAMDNCVEMQSYQMESISFRHQGEHNQKFSLYTGVMHRDPTKDKRMIEFVMQIPLEQFNKSGEGRRLIRGYMKEFLPDAIFNEKRKGRQSADLRARLLQERTAIQKEWKDNYICYQNNGRVDCGKALLDLEKNPMENMSDFDVVRHIYTQDLLEYIATVSKST